MRYYCTHFDINYVAHARSLYDSLGVTNDSFTLFMFCMCDESFSFLSKLDLKSAKLIHYSELERFIPDLLVAKGNRTKVEYFYTCSPATSYYVLNNFDEVDIITYLDADLYFFSSPEPIFKELGENSVGIIEHGFSWFNKRNIKYGKYNVGWINFRNDSNGHICLKGWLDRCINWCYQKVEKDRYADQKYLDFWPSLYNGIYEIKHKGANLGLWNIANYKLLKTENDIYVDNEKLIFYHFANLKQINYNLFKTDLSKVFMRTSGVIKTDIYVPYIKKLISNRYENAKIIAKKDTHISGLSAKIVRLASILREVMFPDVVEINKNL